MTNIALLFSIDPEIPSLLKSLVLMCGNFTRNMPRSPVSEWNSFVDPHASAIVYRAKPPVHRSIGLDVTLQVKMDSNEVRERFTSRLLLPVRDFAEVWFERAPHITFHDPLAAVTIFEDSICGFERGDVEVEIESSRLGGHTAWKANPEGQHEVALTVDPQAFFDHFFAVTEAYT